MRPGLALPRRQHQARAGPGEGGSRAGLCPGGSEAPGDRGALQVIQEFQFLPSDMEELAILPVTGPDSVTEGSLLRTLTAGVGSREPRAGNVAETRVRDDATRSPGQQRGWTDAVLLSVL